MSADFEELRLRLFRVGPGRYLVVLNGAEIASAVIDLLDPQRFVAARNQLLREEFGQCDRPAGVTSSPRERLQALGESLYSTLFPSKLDRVLRSLILRLSKQMPLQHLRLRFTLENGLEALPIEILRVPKHDPLGFLAFHPARPAISLVRSLQGNAIPSERLPGPADQPEPLSLLIAVAAPRGMELPRAGDEVRQLLAQLNPLRQPETGFVRVDLLANQSLEPGHVPRPVTCDNLRSRAGDLEGPSAVLIIAHGSFDESQQQGVVWLENHRGEPVEVPGRDVFADILAQAPGLRLVMLNLCRGTQTAPESQVGPRLVEERDPYVGIAQALIAAGIPAVVAMQFDIGDGAASLFSPTCLELIVQNNTLDHAVRHARVALTRLPEGTDVGSVAWTTTEWCIPACLMHAGAHHGGRLFKVKEVIEDDVEPADPLAEGQRALDDFIRVPRVATAVEAIRYCRRIYDWEKAENICKVALFRNRDHEVLNLFRREILVERQVRSIHEVCEQVAQSSDPSRLKNHLEQVATELGEASDVLQPLQEELAAIDKALHSYQSGLGLESTNRFDQAHATYEGLLSGALAPQARRLKDLSLRHVYTRGRRTEEAAADEPSWSSAARDYARAGAVYGDAALRSAYCLGRIAEQREAWREAMNAYARVTDHNLYPDLLVRRAHVSIRYAMKYGDWSEALGWLRNVDLTPPDQPLSEQDRQTLRSVQSCVAGLEAEARGEWRQAADHYRAVQGSLGSEMAVRQAYCHGREAELRSAWAEAATAFDAAGEVFSDARHRAQYARSVELELDDRWEEAHDRFDSLPREFRDARARALYCLGHVEEAASHWDQAVAAYTAALEAVVTPRTGKDSDVKLAVEENWTTAARQRLEIAKVWVSALERISVKQWSQALHELRRLAQKCPSDPRIAQWQQWCHNLRALTPVLQQMATGTVDDPYVPWPGSGQADASRVPEDLHRRLQFDFSLFAVQDPQCVQAVAAQLFSPEGVAAPITLAEIAGRLGEDAAVFWALLADHSRAQACFQERAQANPADVDALHRLAIAAAGKIAAAVQNGEAIEASDTTQLIVGLAAVFVNNAFWDRFRKECHRRHGEDPGDDMMAKVRRELQTFWNDYLQTIGGSALATTFTSEVRGALCVREAGGILLASDRSRAILGRLGVQAFHLENAFLRWCAVDDSGELQGVRRRELALCFSELVRACVYRDGQRDAEVIEFLVSPPSVDTDAWRVANPLFAELPDGATQYLAARRELLTEAYCGLAGRALRQNPIDCAGAFRAWSQAAEVDPDQRGRICAAAYEHSRRFCGDNTLPWKERLHHASAILRFAVDQGWASFDPRVRRELVDIYLDLAEHYSLDLHEDTQARQYALLAYELDRDGARSLSVLAQVTVLLAYQRLSDRDQARWLADAAEAVLARGMKLYPGHEEMEAMRKELEELLAILRPTTDVPPIEVHLDKVSNHLIEAWVCEARDDFAGAVRCYLEALRADPNNAEASAKLPWCYRRWLTHLNDMGATGERDEVAREAFKRFPHSSALVDIFEALDGDLRGEDNG